MLWKYFKMPFRNGHCYSSQCHLYHQSSYGHLCLAINQCNPKRIANFHKLESLTASCSFPLKPLAFSKTFLAIHPSPFAGTLCCLTAPVTHTCITTEMIRFNLPYTSLLCSTDGACCKIEKSAESKHFQR
jgi:hypothetical protein